MVFLLALVVISLFLLVLPDSWRVNESTDYSFFYEPVARNILAGKGYVQRDNIVAPYYPPGYPSILAILFGLSTLLGVNEKTILTLFVVVISALSTVPLVFVTRKATNNLSALFTGILWMTYPFFLWLTKQPNSEIPFIALLFGGCALLFSASCFNNKSKKNYLISGILLGLAILVRPIAVFFPLVLAFSVLISLSDAKIIEKALLMATFLGGCLIPVIPWEIYVYSNTGKVVLISENSSVAMRGGLIFAVVDSSYKNSISVPSDVRELMEDINAHYEELAPTEKLLSYLKVKILESPLPVVKLFAIKALRSWYATDRQSYENYIILVQIPYLILILLGSWLAWKRGGASRSLMIGIWLVTLCNWGMNMLVTSTLRYMVPVIGLQLTLIAQIPFYILGKYQTQEIKG